MDILTLEEALQKNADFVCLELEKDMIDGLFKLQDKLCFPIGTMISEALMLFVNAFLPVVDVYDKGEITWDSLKPLEFNVKRLRVQCDIAEARIKREFLKGSRKCKKLRA